MTPVASSEMMTGAGPAGHWVMGMNWYHRVERRYIEYGSSFEATRTFGLFRAMYDLVYNMNLDHLSWEAETVFERLGDAGMRTAATPFLIYRGRQPPRARPRGTGPPGGGRRQLPPRRLGARRVLLRRPLRQPSRPGADRRSPGQGPATSTRPASAEELVREGAYDFLLFSLPDNDFHSHRHGPEATLESIGKADSMFARIVEAGGGLDAFLADHAVILTADHAQTDVEHALPLADELAEDWAVLQPNADRPEEAEIAVSPTSRAGAVYILDSGRRHPVTHERARLRLRELDRSRPGHLAGGGRRRPVVRTGVGLPDAGAVEAVVERNGYELRFRPGGQLRDRRGNRWAVSGEPEALAGDVTRGRFESHEYPDGLARLWSALTSPHAGDVLISAAEGYECVDWGGVSHVGGGSHGSLGRGGLARPGDVRGLRPRGSGRAAAVGAAGPRPGDPGSLRRRYGERPQG